MADIARAAGVGRATLYRRYASRDDLLRAIRMEALEDCAEALGGVRVAPGEARTALRAATRALIAVLDRYRVLAQAPRLDRRDPVLRSAAERIEAPLAAIVAAGAADGTFRSDLPPDFAAAALTSLLTAARRGVVENGLDVAQVEDAVVDAMEGMLLSPSAGG